MLLLIFWMNTLKDERLIGENSQRLSIKIYFFFCVYITLLTTLCKS